MSRTKAKQPSKPSPAKKAKEAPGTKAPVNGDHSMDEVLNAPLRPTHEHLSAPPKWMGHQPAYLLEATPAPSTVKPVNTGTGAAKATPTTKGKKNA